MKLNSGDLYTFKSKESIYQAAVFTCMCSLGALSFFEYIKGKIDEKTIFMFLEYQTHDCGEDILTNSKIAIFLMGDVKMYFRTFEEDNLYRFNNYISKNIYEDLIKSKQVNIEELLIPVI